MISVTTNIGTVSASLLHRFRDMKAQLNDKLVRTVADNVLFEMKDRIHELGQKADSSPIGTYSNNYLKFRERRKGGKKVTDPKVTFYLTGKMEREYQVIATQRGYGLGWIDSGGGSGQGRNAVTNFDKANFLEERFGSVYSLTSKENKIVKDTTENFIKQNLNT